MKSSINWLVTFIATAGGAGFFPKAPGTAGSLVAIPILWWVAEFNSLEKSSLWLFILLIGTWASTLYCERSGSKDNQQIVIDEVIGMGISGWTMGRSWPGLIAVFVLFRIFDTSKPPPVRQVDRWSKTQSNRWAIGFGVIADDMLAGVQTLACIMIAEYYGWL